MVRYRWFGVGALFTLVLACSSSRDTGSDSVASSSAAIQSGTDDTTDKFAVGVCLGGHATGGGGYQCQAFCSGALILPNVVVTARHCVSELASEEVDCSTAPKFLGDYQASNLSITTNDSMFVNTGYHAVKSVVVPTDNHICGNDIALLILNGTIAASEAKTVVPGVQYPMGDQTRYSQRFNAIGFGSTTGDRQAQNSGVGQRRIHTGVSVACIPGDEIFDCPAAAGVPANEFIAGNGSGLLAFACAGDSGSSAFDTKTFATGSPVTYGVLSRGGADASNNCIQNTYTRLDKWRDLVVNTANSASNNWTLYPKPTPDWTVFVPLPVTDGGADGAKGPGTGAVGDPCTSPKDCATTDCIDPGDGNQICSQACDDSNPCPDSFSCSDSLCVPADPTPDASTVDTGSSTTTSGCGCKTVNSAETAGSAGWIAALALGLVAARRRRR